MTPRLIVIAKQPVPGRVKTRLCPPCTPEQAAAIADAALRDTLDVVSAARGVERWLVVAGEYPAPPGWETARQRGDGLGERLARAFADTGGGPALLVGMDTPQLTPALLNALGERLRGEPRADAVLAPASDGGWWALALRDPRHAAVLQDVVMSTSDTYRDTWSALTAVGVVVAAAPTLTDVDTAADAWEVAALCPRSRFAATVRRILGPVPRAAPVRPRPVAAPASEPEPAVAGGSR